MKDKHTSDLAMGGRAARPVPTEPLWIIIKNKSGDEHTTVYKIRKYDDFSFSG